MYLLSTTAYGVCDESHIRASFYPSAQCPCRLDVMMDRHIIVCMSAAPENKWLDSAFEISLLGNHIKCFQLIARSIYLATQMVAHALETKDAHNQLHPASSAECFLDSVSLADFILSLSLNVSLPVGGEDFLPVTFTISCGQQTSFQLVENCSLTLWAILIRWTWKKKCSFKL